MQRKKFTTGIFLTFLFLLMLSFFSINKMGLTGFVIGRGAEAVFSLGFILSALGFVGVIYYFFIRQR